MCVYRHIHKVFRLGKVNRRLVYRLRASTWQPVDWGFIPSRVILKTLKIVFAAFAPGARRKRKCEGFCVCVVHHVMSLNSVQSFVIENCNGPTIENGLNNVCLHPLSRTFTFGEGKRLFSVKKNILRYDSWKNDSRRRQSRSSRPPNPPIGGTLPKRGPKLP